MYFVGKEAKDEKLGILCASITALSSFLIYFSQEVRFYGLLFLFSSLSLLFTLKLFKEQKPSNTIGYIVSNFLIIFTHTLGIIFVFFNLIFVSLGLLKTNIKLKKIIIITWGSLILFTLINIPLMFKIFISHPNSQFWGHFTFSKIGFLITDYFSPILTNVVSSPDNFFYNPTFGFTIFAILPSLIAITGIVKALITKKYEILGLFYVCLSFILTLVIMAISGKLMFITKYSIEIYPILITIMAYGLLGFKNAWRYGLIFLFCFLNLFYILVDSNSAPKMHRSEGHKIVADLVKNANLRNGDIILLTYYPQNRFQKYFDFNQYKVISIDKGSYANYLGINSKEEFKNIQTKIFDKKFKAEVLNKLKHKQKISILVLKDVAIYSPMQIHALLNNKKEYEKTPFLFLVFSQLKNDILKTCLENLQIQRIEEKGSWLVITFKKN